MKSRAENYVSAVVFAALAIIGCSVSSMLSCRSRRTYHRQLLDEAVQTWEGEGGTVFVKNEEDDEGELLTRT